MKNHKEYKKSILTLFENYLKNNNRVELIEGLTSYEKLISMYTTNRDTNKRLWFKFYKDDNLATLISEIDKDLNLYITSANNFDYMVNNLKLAIEKKELKIYFS